MDKNENTLFKANFVEVRCLKPIAKAISDSVSNLLLEITKEGISCSFPSRSGRLSFYLEIIGDKLPLYFLKSDVPIFKTISSDKANKCISKSGVTSTLSVTLDKDSLVFEVEVSSSSNATPAKPVEILTEEGSKCPNLAEEFSSYPDKPAIKIICKDLKSIKDLATTTSVTHANISISDTGRMEVTTYSGKTVFEGSGEEKVACSEVMGTVNYVDEPRPYNFYHDCVVNGLANDIPELMRRETEAKSCEVNITNKECDLFHMLSGITSQDYMVPFYISDKCDKILISSEFGSFGTIDIVISN